MRGDSLGRYYGRLLGDTRTAALRLFCRQSVEQLIQFLFGIRLGNQRMRALVGGHRRQLPRRLNDVRRQENEEFRLGAAGGLSLKKISQQGDVAEKWYFRI